MHRVLFGKDPTCTMLGFRSCQAATSGLLGWRSRAGRRAAGLQTSLQLSSLRSFVSVAAEREISWGCSSDPWPYNLLQESRDTVPYTLTQSQTAIVVAIARLSIAFYFRRYRSQSRHRPNMAQSQLMLGDLHKRGTHKGGQRGGASHLESPRGGQSKYSGQSQA